MLAKNPTAGPQFRVEPVLGVISAVVGALLGYVANLVSSAFGRGDNIPLAVVSGVAFAVGLGGLLAARPESGRIRTLLGLTSGLFLGVTALATAVLALVAAGTTSLVVVYGLLACVYVAVAYGLLRSGQ